MFRRLAAILAALGLVLMIAAPAFANPVEQGNVSFDNVDFQADSGECPAGTVDTGEVLWHFVHTMTDTSDLPSTLTAQFLDASGGTVTLTAEGYQNGNDSSQVFYDITTPTGYTFVSGSDTIDNFAAGGRLNLSHICQGGPPPEIPEAPASALLILTAGALVAGFIVLRMRRSNPVA